jgi:hypothetical protein
MDAPNPNVRVQEVSAELKQRRASGSDTIVCILFDPKGKIKSVVPFDILVFL